MMNMHRGRAWLAGGLALGMAMLVPDPVALAATLDEVTMPDRETVAGTELRLNGIGLRTVTFLAIRVYVAGLFLEAPSTDGEAILGSNKVRLLQLHFVRDVPVEKVRQGWREAFERECHGPCPVPESSVRQFLDAAPEMHKGDIVRFEFTARSLLIRVNGRELGQIHDRDLERIVLATFLGQSPGSQKLKAELLGERH